jgi:hypothetical protein
MHAVSFSLYGKHAEIAYLAFLHSLRLQPPDIFCQQQVNGSDGEK